MLQLYWSIIDIDIPCKHASLIHFQLIEAIRDVGHRNFPPLTAHYSARTKAVALLFESTT